MDNTCLGFTNHRTAMVALAIDNERDVNALAKAFMLTYQGKRPYRDFLRQYDMECKTVPGYDFVWSSYLVSYAEIDNELFHIND